MTATLTYSLPEEADEHRLALDGWRWRGVCAELDEALRGRLKHGEPMTEDATAAWAWVRGRLRELIAEEGLTLE